MLVVKLELWPHGDEKRKREIGRTYIANVGGSVSRGEYVAAVCRRGRHEVPRDLYAMAGSTETNGPRATRVGHVHDYPRLAYNVWRLVVRALRSCFPEEG